MGRAGLGVLGQGIGRTWLVVRPCAVGGSFLSSCFGGRAQLVLTPPPPQAALALTCRAAGEVKQEQAQNLLCWGL